MVNIPPSLRPPSKPLTLEQQKPKSKSYPITPTPILEQTSQVIEEQRVEGFSLEAWNYAIYNIERKAQGKRIVWNESNRQEAVQAYNYILNKYPDVRDAVEKGNEARGRAIELGFNNVEEYVAAQGLAKNYINPARELPYAPVTSTKYNETLKSEAKNAGFGANVEAYVNYRNSKPSTVIVPPQVLSSVTSQVQETHQPTKEEQKLSMSLANQETKTSEQYFFNLSPRQRGQIIKEQFKEKGFWEGIKYTREKFDESVSKSADKIGKKVAEKVDIYITTPRKGSSIPGFNMISVTPEGYEPNTISQYLKTSLRNLRNPQVANQTNGTTNKPIAILSSQATGGTNNIIMTPSNITDTKTKTRDFLENSIRNQRERTLKTYLSTGNIKLTEGQQAKAISTVVNYGSYGIPVFGQTRFIADITGGGIGIGQEIVKIKQEKGVRAVPGELTSKAKEFFTQRQAIQEQEKLKEEELKYLQEIKQGTNEGKYEKDSANEAIEQSEKNLEIYEQNIKSIKSGRIVRAVVTGATVGYLGYKGVRAGSKYFIETPIIKQSKLVPEYTGATSDTLGLVSKPVERRIYRTVDGKVVIQDTFNVRGYTETVKEGQKTVVTNRLREMLGMKPIYEGTPFERTSKLDAKNFGLLGKKTSYQNARDYLIGSGYSEKETSSILRLVKPKKSTVEFSGRAITQQKEDEAVKILIQGTEKTKPVKGFVEDVPYKTDEPTIEFIETSTKTGKELNKIPIAESNIVSKKAYLNEKGEPFSKLSQRGKTKTETYGLTASSQIKETDIYSVYKQKGRFRDTLPKRRKSEPSSSKIFIMKGEPDVTLEFNSLTGNLGSVSGKKVVDSVKGGLATVTAQEIKQVQISKEQERGLADALGNIIGRPRGGKSPKAVQAARLEQTEIGIAPVKTKTISKQASALESSQESIEVRPRFLGGVSRESNVLISDQGSGVREKEDQKSDQRLVTDTREDLATGFVLSSFPFSGLRQEPSQVEEEKQSQAPILRQEIKQTQAQVTSLIPRPNRPRITNISSPKIPDKPTRKIPKFFFPGERENTKSEQPFDVYVLIDSTKGKKAKYQKVNVNPLTEGSALSLGARIVDKTISARFKIVPTSSINQKGKVVRPKALDTNDDYFETFSSKFRNYRVRKGKPIPTGEFIERSKFRLERGTGEIPTIQKARREASVKGMFGF